MFFTTTVERQTPSLLAFVLFDTLLHSLHGVHPTGDETDCQEVTRAMLLRYLYWCEEHCYLSSTDNKLWSYIFPSYLLKRLHNEIDWEKKKNPYLEKLPKEGGGGGGE